MRIVHAANFSVFKYGANYYFTDDKISNGLIRNGHYVYNFSYRDVARSENWLKTKSLGKKKANLKLIETCQNVKPELLLLGHTEIIEPQTLSHIKELIPSIKIAMWFVDPLWMEHHHENIIAKLPFLDCFFATTSGALLKEFKRPNTTVAYLPNMCDPSVETHQNFTKIALEYDFAFCGRDYKEPERQAFLVNLHQKVSSLSSRFCGCLDYKPLFGSDYYDLLSNTAMSMSYNRRNDVELYMSDRIVQLTGNGILTFSPRIPKMELLYSKDEVVYFDTLEDLSEKIQSFHKDTKKRQHIAQKGWEKTQHSFNNTRITKYMMETIFNQPLSENYEWKDERF